MSHVTRGTLASMLADYATRVLDDPATSDDIRDVVRDVGTSTAKLDDLMGMAHERMPSGHHQWRMLYIDAAILQVLARASICELHEDALRACIATLDRAIVIAGAGVDDVRRDHVVHDLIGRLQSAIPCQHAPSSAVLVPQPAPVHPLSTARGSLPTCAALPSLTTPHEQWSRAPFVLRGYADDWPAMHPPRQWASLAYLFSAAGPGRTVPVEVGDDYRSNDWSQKLINWEDLLSSLDTSTSHHPVYLAQHSLLAQFPKLREDIILPDIVYASLDSPDFPNYAPPSDTILNAWLGPKGTMSPAHTDPFFNCYVQVVGRKTVWLASPAVATAMYPYQPPLASADADPLMNNTSQVDVFLSASHDIEASQSAFPLFWDRVPNEATCVTLNPGDLLFFPPGWWHAMRSEDASFSVSMWF